MPSLDINFDYKKIQNKINATKSYTDIKSQYNDANKKVGESLIKEMRNQMRENLKLGENKASEIEEDSDVFKEIVDIKQVWIADEYGDNCYVLVSSGYILKSKANTKSKSLSDFYDGKTEFIVREISIIS